MTVFESLINIRLQKGAGFIVLIDPDKLPENDLAQFAEKCERADVDCFFIGGSLMHTTELDRYAGRLKSVTSLPVVGFPGSLSQLASPLDAILYLSVISSRNPEFLIGQHIYAAPLIKRLGIEPIATGYMLVESGRTTTAQYMSNSMPIPRDKPDVAAATGLAAEMMGMKLLFADGGSGAQQTVPDEIISAISDACTTPLIIGGGLKDPVEVSRKIDAGAAFVVVGNAIEKNPDGGYIAELADAAHTAVPRQIGRLT